MDSEISPEAGGEGSSQSSPQKRKEPEPSEVPPTHHSNPSDQHLPLPQGSTQNRNNTTSEVWSSIKPLSEKGREFLGTPAKNSTHICVHPVSVDGYLLNERGQAYQCNTLLKLSAATSKTDKMGHIVYSTSVGLNHLKKAHPKCKAALDSFKRDSEGQQQKVNIVVACRHEESMASQSSKTAREFSSGPSGIARNSGQSDIASAFGKKQTTPQDKAAQAQAEW